MSLIAAHHAPSTAAALSSTSPPRRLGGEEVTNQCENDGKPEVARSRHSLRIRPADPISSMRGAHSGLRDSWSGHRGGPPHVAQSEGGYAMRTFDLAPLYRSTVGYERLFSLLDQVSGFEGSGSTYPPYNIERAGEKAHRIPVTGARLPGTGTLHPAQ